MVYSRQGNFSDLNCGFGYRGGVFSSSQTEYLLELAHGVLGVLDRVSDDPGVLIEVVVVAPDIGLVAEKVDLVETLDVVEAVPLVPTLEPRGTFKFGGLFLDSAIVKFIALRMHT